MNTNFESAFADIDYLLAEVDQATSINFAEIDDLCAEVDAGLDNRKQEVSTWPEERKRKEAMDSGDPFVLNLLSMDENFNVRTLAACNPNTPANSLRRLIEGTNDYIRMVIANNTGAPADVLDRITELSGEHEVLSAVKLNPNVSAVTRYKIENRV